MPTPIVSMAGPETTPLDGGAGNDTYVFGRGYGADTIASLDTTVGQDRHLAFWRASGSDISLSREIDDLLVLRFVKFLPPRAQSGPKP